MLPPDEESDNIFKKPYYAISGGEGMPKKNKGEYVAFRPDRGWWGILEYVHGRRVWHVSGLASRGQAEVAYAQRVLARGKRDPEEITLGEIMAYYLDNKAPYLARPDNAAFFHKKLKGFWADKKLKDLNQANIRLYHQYADKEYKKWQKSDKHKEIKPISNAAVRRYLEHLRACVRLAANDRIIPYAPPITLPDKGKSKDRWLTRKEAAALLKEARKLKYAKTYLPRFIRIALRTGARKSAILNLKWTHVDLINQTIDFRPIQRSQIKGATVAAIPDRQMPYFRAIRKDMGYVIHAYGSPVKDVEKSFLEACRNAGLEGVTIHTLRHTFASWLKQDGQDSSLIAKALGHKSTSMVDHVYGHMGTGYVEKLRKAVR